MGGGSVRIHNPSLQERVLQLLDIKKDTLQHIIDMLGKLVVFMWSISIIIILLIQKKTSLIGQAVNPMYSKIIGIFESVILKIHNYCNICVLICSVKIISSMRTGSLKINY